MIIKEVKEAIFNGVEKDFSDEGFKLIKSKDRFDLLSKKDGCRFIYSFLFHGRTSEIAIENFILIEHLETEKLYKVATDQKMSETIGNELGKIVRNPSGKMKDHSSQDIIIRSERDIEAANEDIRNYFKDVAIPYYQKNGNLKRIDEILNDNPTKVSVHANTQSFRCMKGLIVAKLIGRENFDELLFEYDKKMRTMSDLSKNRYEAVKKHLENL